MNEGSTITAGIAEPKIRPMNHNELPTVFGMSLRRRSIERVSDVGDADRQREQVGWVAEVQGRSAGFAVCAVVQPAAASQGANPLRSLTQLFRRLLGLSHAQPQYVEMLDLVVEPDPAWAEVEQALLRRLMEELQLSWGRVPVVVPERNLEAQVFLRDARYKAIRVLHAYYGDEDGYLMTDEIDSLLQ